MQPQEGAGVQYSRWNNSTQDEVSVTTATELTAWNRLYATLCTGRVGIAVKVLGGLLAFWIIFIIGYVTGYYIHKCK
ncbi:small integral membrane protein 1 [Rhinatrema bivittatum]|uniref:small integral membrane protein 1 n=1 Tax=Rhinatrema bivittatum TaxID=194408 RepID=UPI00112CD71E|nr:small integral membrane protein 1 [Rhinatrema bivittatum]